MPEAERRYDAFISYRHVEPDRTWAKWLHRELESFTTPRSLRRRGVPARIERVFRDEEELPASADLSREIDTALEQSRFLIVICSPRAPESAWVNQEVVRFREMGRHDRILALLIEGEPIDAFPRALCEIRSEVVDADGEVVEHIEDVEPLAADVRASRDESPRFLKRMALLRFSAALLGCRFDDLRRRDLERLRRRRAVGAGLVLLVLALIGGTYFVQERQKADILERSNARLARQLRATYRARARDLLVADDVERAATILAELQQPTFAPAHEDDRLLLRFALDRLAPISEMLGELRVGDVINWRGSSYLRTSSAVVPLPDAENVTVGIPVPSRNLLVSQEDGDRLALRRLDTGALIGAARVSVDPLAVAAHDQGPLLVAGVTQSSSVGGATPVAVWVDPDSGAAEPAGATSRNPSGDELRALLDQSTSSTGGFTVDRVSASSLRFEFPRRREVEETWAPGRPLPEALRGLSCDGLSLSQCIALLGRDASDFDPAWIDELGAGWIDLRERWPSLDTEDAPLRGSATAIWKHADGAFVLGQASDGAQFGIVHIVPLEGGAPALDRSRSIRFHGDARGPCAVGGRWLLVSDFAYMGHPALRVVDARTLQDLPLDHQPPGGPLVAAFSPGGSRLAVPGGDGLWIYRLGTEGTLVHRVELLRDLRDAFDRWAVTEGDEALGHVAFVGEDHVLVASSRTVALYDASTGQVVWSSAHPFGAAVESLRVTTSADGRILTLVGGSLIELRLAEDGTPLLRRDFRAGLDAPGPDEPLVDPGAPVLGWVDADLRVTAWMEDGRFLVRRPPPPLSSDLTPERWTAVRGGGDLVPLRVLDDILR